MAAPTRGGLPTPPMFTTRAACLAGRLYRAVGQCAGGTNQARVFAHLPLCATRGSATVLTEMGQFRASARARPATRSRRDETVQNTQSRSAPHQESLLAGSMLHSHFWADSGALGRNCLH